MEKKGLSAVVITFNEESNIVRCIRSLQGVVDEIIVLDSYSTDGTVEVISGLPKVKVCQRQWEGFSAAKNHANQLAAGPLILSIDADEALSEQLTASIADNVKLAAPDTVYSINRLTNYCGRWIHHGGWYPDRKVRIFPKLLATWKGDLHEELAFAGPVTVKALDGPLYHYSYPTFQSHLKKIISYAPLAARQDFERGRKYTLLVNGLIKPFFVFFKKYFLQLGFMDGFAGFVIAVNSSYERFLRYLEYRELTR